MASKKTAVYGIYSSVLHAEQTVDKLIIAGFPSGDISVLVPDSTSTRDFAHKKETKAPEGATTGATAGGLAAVSTDASADAAARLLRPGSGSEVMDAH